MKKNIEAKVSMTENVLRFFCMENADSIIGCAWYNTRHCLKNCKFYKDKQKQIEEAKTGAKYWTR